TAETAGICARIFSGKEDSVSKAADFFIVSGNSEEALPLLWKAGRWTEMILAALPLAEQDNSSAREYIGRAYEEGKGVPADSEWADKWFKNE
ncbi:MAG: hypothetical protein J5494_01860, partial [Candidatus Methanomethylophilaceae archaeon]|nr:hypothetical protein [Candidatus Methanomethylophilaceae archaeon]